MNVHVRRQRGGPGFLGWVLISAIALAQLPITLQAFMGGGCTNVIDCPDLIDYSCPKPPGKGDGCATCDRNNGGAGAGAGGVGAFGGAGGGAGSAGLRIGSGMPTWRVSEPQISLWIHDEPLGYQPAYGPRISFLLSYKQRDHLAGLDPNVFSAGIGWNISWLSYVVPDSTSADVYFAGGGVVRLLASDNV